MACQKLPCDIFGSRTESAECLAGGRLDVFMAAAQEYWQVCLYDDDLQTLASGFCMFLSRGRSVKERINWYKLNSAV